MSVSNLSYSPSQSLLVGAIQCQSLQASSVQVQNNSAGANVGLQVQNQSAVAGSGAQVALITNGQYDQKHIFNQTGVQQWCTGLSGADAFYHMSATGNYTNNDVFILDGNGNLTISGQVSAPKFISQANVANNGFSYALNSLPVSTGVSGQVVTCNGVAGVCSFTSTIILSGGTSTMTIANSMAGSVGHVTVEFRGASATSAPFVDTITWNPNASIVISCKNGGSYSTSAMTVKITFSKLA